MPNCSRIFLAFSLIHVELLPKIGLAHKPGHNQPLGALILKCMIHSIRLKLSRYHILNTYESKRTEVRKMTISERSLLTGKKHEGNLWDVGNTLLSWTGWWLYGYIYMQNWVMQWKVVYSMHFIICTLSFFKKVNERKWKWSHSIVSDSLQLHGL